MEPEVSLPFLYITMVKRMHTSVLQLAYIHNELYTFRPTTWPSSGI